MSTLRTILASGRVALHSKPSRRQLHGAPAHLAIPRAHRVLLQPGHRSLRSAVPTRCHPLPRRRSWACGTLLILAHPALQRRTSYVAAGAAFGTVMAYRNDLKQLQFDLASATGGAAPPGLLSEPARRAPLEPGCPGCPFTVFSQLFSCQCCGGAVSSPGGAGSPLPALPCLLPGRCSTPCCAAVLPCPPGPLVRLFDVETSHKIGIAAAKLGFFPRETRPDPPSLRTTVWGRDFPNPLGEARRPCSAPCLVPRLSGRRVLAGGRVARREAASRPGLSPTPATAACSMPPCHSRRRGRRLRQGRRGGGAPAGPGLWLRRGGVHHAAAATWQPQATRLPPSGIWVSTEPLLGCLPSATPATLPPSFLVQRVLLLAGQGEARRALPQALPTLLQELWPDTTRRCPSSAAVSCCR